jgi:hypothetical protein
MAAISVRMAEHARNQVRSLRPVGLRTTPLSHV